MKTRLIIFAIVLSAILIRLYNIEQKNLWFDEVYSWKISQQNVTNIVIETSGDIHPPLYYVTLNYWTGLFSDSVISMRILSVLFGILSMYFVFRISRLCLKNNLQIILVLLLYAFSPLNIFYSQEVRMLNLNLFLCLGSVYYFLKFIDSDSKINGALYLIFTTLALYTHYFAFLILFTEAVLIVLYFYFDKINLKTVSKYFVYFLFINILFAPWYPVFFEQIAKGQPWRTQQTFMEVGTDVIDYFKDVFLSPYYTFESTGLLSFSVFLSFLIIAFIIYLLLKVINSKSIFTEKSDSIVFFFLVPLVTAILISFNQSILLSRYLSILIPYLFIMLVFFSFKLYNNKIVLMFISFLIIVSCYGSYIYFNNKFKNNDYRKIITYLEGNFDEKDNIIVEPHYMGWIFNYHLKHEESNLKPPEIFGWNLKMQVDSLNHRTEMDNVWMILDYSALGKNNYDSLSVLMNQIGYTKIKGKSFYLMPEKVKVEYYQK